MNPRLFWTALILLAASLRPFSGGWAAMDFFRIEDLRAGMKGIGKTCFDGTVPEEFNVEILGVLRGTTPGADAVLARFRGDRLDPLGIFEGMSGSPVYVDGKLLGAVAYSYAFSKEAIGGITPIGQMIGAFEETERLSSKPDPEKSGLSVLPLPAIAADDGRVRERILLGGLYDPTQSASRRPVNAGPSSGRHALLPIATPLHLGGFHPKVLDFFTTRFREAGISLLQGAAGARTAISEPGRSTDPEPPFVPGSNIVVTLMQGDLEVSAGGTVTHVDGDRVYAFGHSFMELGYTELPLHKAQTVAVVPSLESSFKIFAADEMVGTLRQDRGMGIYGITGARPHLVPVRIGMRTSRGASRSYEFRLVRDRLLTPLLLQMAVYNSIVASERVQGAATIEVSGEIRIKDEAAVHLASRFSSENGVIESASLAVAVPVDALMASTDRNLDLERIDLQVASDERDLSSRLDSIRVDRAQAKAGHSFSLDIACRRTDGEIERRSYPVLIPQNIYPGKATLLVADGATLTAMDQREGGAGLNPRDLRQRIRYINNIRRNDRLYLRLWRREPGVATQGEVLPALPPSILSVLKSDRKSGEMTNIHSAILMEHEIPGGEGIVVGSRSIGIEITP